MKAILVPNKEKITLENVKKSDYWKLISLIVWSHYNEEKFQDESLIEIKQSFHGKDNNNGSTHHSLDWNNLNFTKEGYTRVMDALEISLKRNDYHTYIRITTSGDVSYFGMYVNKDKDYSPNFRNGNQVEICNWLIEHGFLMLNENL